MLTNGSGGAASRCKSRRSRGRSKYDLGTVLHAFLLMCRTESHTFLHKCCNYNVHTPFLPCGDSTAESGTAWPHKPMDRAARNPIFHPRSASSWTVRTLWRFNFESDSSASHPMQSAFGPRVHVRDIVLGAEKNESVRVPRRAVLRPRPACATVFTNRTPKRDPHLAPALLVTFTFSAFQKLENEVTKSSAPKSHLLFV